MGDAQNMLITFLHSCCHCDLKIALQKICYFEKVFIMIFYYILFINNNFQNIYILTHKVPKLIHSETNSLELFLQLFFLNGYLSFFNHLPTPPFFYIFSSLFFLSPYKVDERKYNKHII